MTARTLRAAAAAPPRPGPVESPARPPREHQSRSEKQREPEQELVPRVSGRQAVEELLHAVEEHHDAHEHGDALPARRGRAPRRGVARGPFSRAIVRRRVARDCAATRARAPARRSVRYRRSRSATGRVRAAVMRWRGPLRPCRARLGCPYCFALRVPPPLLFFSHRTGFARRPGTASPGSRPALAGDALDR